MAVSKAQQKAQNKWIAKAYDRINLTVAKGKKDIIQAYAEAQGKSVNAYINTAIDEKMSREAVGSPTRAVISKTTLDISGDNNDALGRSDGRREGIVDEG
jgi:uncharacterized protein (UPF0254 family)